MTPCRWLVDEKCIYSPAKLDFNEVVVESTSEEICPNCSHYYSLIDSENVRKIEDGELFDV